MATIWRVAFQGTFSSAIQIVNVLHVKDDPVLGPDARSAHQMADELDTWLSTLWRAQATPHVVLDTIKVTETQTSSDTSPAEQWVKDIGLAGSRAGADGLLDPALCLWTKSLVAQSFKGNHGGIHAPPSYDQSDWQTDGLAVTSSSYWTAVGAFNNALQAGHDYGTILGHLSYVLYSQTRRDRGDADWYFDVTAMSRSRRMHFLRSRTTAP